MKASDLLPDEPLDEDVGKWVRGAAAGAVLAAGAVGAMKAADHSGHAPQRPGVEAQFFDADKAAYDLVDYVYQRDDLFQNGNGNPRIKARMHDDLRQRMKFLFLKIRAGSNTFKTSQPLSAEDNEIGKAVFKRAYERFAHEHAGDERFQKSFVRTVFSQMDN